jgi:ribosomal protein S18 acetylase RimI-like enzyme
MLQLEYRPLLEDDIAAIARVHRRACLIAYAFMNWSYSEEEVRHWYASKFSDWDWGLVAEEKGAVVGFVATSGTRIDQLFVDPDHQKLGIGTSLLHAALQRLPEAATLTVFEENKPARRFYERHGFREVRRSLNEQEQSVELGYARPARMLGR